MAKAKDREQGEERKAAEEMLARVSEELDKLTKMGIDAPEATSRFEAARARIEDGSFHEAEMLAGEAVLMAKAMREMAAISVSVSQKEETERRAVRKQVIREVGEQLTALMSGPLSPERIRAQINEIAEKIFKESVGKALEDAFAKHPSVAPKDAERMAADAARAAVEPLPRLIEKSAKAEAAAAAKALLEAKPLAKLITDLAKAEASAAVDALPRLSPEDVERAIAEKLGELPKVTAEDVAKAASEAAGAVGEKLQKSIESLPIPSKEEIELPLKKKLEAVAAELSGKVKNSSDKLTAKVDSIVADVTGRLSKLHVPDPKEIDEQIDGKVTPAIEKLSSDLQSRTKELASRIEGTLKDVESRARASADALTKEVKAALAAVSSKVDSQKTLTPADVQKAAAEVVSARLAKVSEEMKAATAKVDSLTAELARKQQSAEKALSGVVDSAIKGLTARIESAKPLDADDVRKLAAAEVAPRLDELRKDLAEEARELAEQATAKLPKLTAQQVSEIVEKRVLESAKELAEQAQEAAEQATSKLPKLTAQQVSEIVEKRVLDSVREMTRRIESLPEPPSGDELAAAAAKRIDEAVGKLLASEEFGKRVRDLAPKGVSLHETMEVARGEVAKALKEAKPLTREEAVQIARSEAKNAAAGVPQLSDEDIHRIAGERIAEALEAAAPLSEERAREISGEVLKAANPLTAEQARAIAEKAMKAAPFVTPEQVKAVFEKALAAAAPVNEVRARAIAAEQAEKSAGISEEEAKALVAEAVADMKGSLIDDERLSGMIRRLAGERAAEVIADTPHVTPQQVLEEIHRSVNDFSRAVLDSKELADMFSKAMGSVKALSAEQVREIARAEAQGAAAGVPQLSDADIERIAGERISEALAKVKPLSKDEVREIARSAAQQSVAGVDAVSAERAADIASGLVSEASEQLLKSDELTKRVEEIASSMTRDVIEPALKKVKGGVTVKEVEAAIDARIKAIETVNPADVKRLAKEVVDSIPKQPGLSAGEVDQIIEGRMNQELDRLLESERLANNMKRIAGAAASAGISEETVRSLIAKHAPEAAKGLSKEAVLQIVEERMSAEGLHRGETMTAPQIDELVEARMKMEFERTFTGKKFVAAVKAAVGEPPKGLDEKAVGAIVSAKVAQALSADALEAALVDVLPAQAPSIDPAKIKEIAASEIEGRLRKALSPSALESIIVDLIPAQGGGGVDEAKVTELVTQVMAERLGRFQKDVLPSLVAKGARDAVQPSIEKVLAAAKTAGAAGAAGGGGGADEKKVAEIAGKLADERVAELEAKVVKALKAQAAGGAIEVTPDMVGRIANSDAFLKMLENRFRVMAEYLKTDVLPKEVKKLMGGG